MPPGPRSAASLVVAEMLAVRAATPASSRWLSGIALSAGQKPSVPNSFGGLVAMLSASSWSPASGASRPRTLAIVIRQDQAESAELTLGIRGLEADAGSAAQAKLLGDLRETSTTR